MSITRGRRTRCGDPLVHDQVAAEPVVLGGNVGQRALARSAPAAARPRAGRAGHARRARGSAREPRARCGARPWRASIRCSPCRQPLSAEEIRDANTRYHDVAAEPLRLQVGHRLRRARPGAGARASCARPLGARADARYRRARSRSAPAPATSRSTCCAAGLIASATCTDISPGMLADAGARTPSGSGSRSARARPTPRQLPFADAELRPRASATRCCTTSRTCRAPSPSSVRVLRPGGTVVFAGEPSRYGDRLAGVPEGARPHARARCGARALRRRPRGGARERRRRCGGRARGGRRRARVRARRARSASRASAGFEEVRVSGEELVANWFGWIEPHARDERRPRGGAVGVAPVRVPRLPRRCSSSTAGCSSRCCRRRSSTTCCSPPRKPQRPTLTLRPRIGLDACPTTATGLPAVPAGHRRAARARACRCTSSRSATALMIEHCLRRGPGSASASSGSCGSPTRSSSRSAARARSSACSSAWTTAA